MDITVSETHLLVKDPIRGKSWRVPRRKITSVDADVSERWVINCSVPLKILQEVVRPSFLEPDVVAGCAVLSLCAIFMRHAAPSWMPLIRASQS